MKTEFTGAEKTQRAWVDFWIRRIILGWNLFYLSIHVWGNWTQGSQKQEVWETEKKLININAVTFEILFKKSRTSISIIGSPSIILSQVEINLSFVLVRETQSVTKVGRSLPVLMKGSHHCNSKTSQDGATKWDVAAKQQSLVVT